MKVKEIMDKEYISVSKNDTLVDVSIKMEETRRLTAPVLDDENHILGWITSLDVTRGFRENKTIVSEIMHSPEEVFSLSDKEDARIAVLETVDKKLISLPIIDEDEKLIGIVRPFDLIHTFSNLYDITVDKLYLAMERELKGITWDELMQASAIIYRRTTGERIKPEEYAERIKKSTFGQAIWATGGLENFFVGLISIGELVIARKIARAKK